MDNYDMYRLLFG